MRMVCLLVVVLGVSVVSAQEAAPNVANEAAKSSDAGKDGAAQPTVVNKPVIDEKKLNALPLEQAAQERKATPLVEHPTLLGMLLRNNQIRARVGLRAHRMNAQLTNAAQDHANYMARTGDFNHYSNLGPGGRASKYGFRVGVLENIAYGYGSIDSAFTTWQNSGGHWANMSSHTTDAGFGYALSANGTPYWVAVYGTAPNPPKNESEVQHVSAEVPVEGAEANAATESNAAPANYSYSNGGNRGLFRRRR